MAGEVPKQLGKDSMVGLFGVGHSQEKRDPTITRTHEIDHKLLELRPMLAGVAVGYTDLFGVLLSFVIVATVQMKRGGIEVNALSLWERQSARRPWWRSRRRAR